MRTLNERQQLVLEWIAAGCPQREWQDYTHRTTAKALQARGLVKVTRPHGVWTATLTDEGRRLLAGEIGPNDVRGDRTTGGRPPVKGRPPGPPVPHVDTADLGQRLHDDGGTLRILDPDTATRAAYRRALAALTPGLLPDGHRLRYTGRDSGDLIIRLVPEPRQEAEPPLPPVPVPSSLNHSLEPAASLSRHRELLPVSDSARERALLLVQALADAARQRGHTCAVREDGQPGFQITVREDTYTFSMTEEEDKVEQVDPGELAGRKYDWQRVSPHLTAVPSGRLVIELDTGTRFGRERWSDRRRWTLDQKLPHVLATVETRAAAAARARSRDLEAKAERRRIWEEAVPKARQAYVDDYNRQRLLAQSAAFDQATSLRRYATHLGNVAATAAPEDAVAVRAWAAWAADQAEQLDPTSKPESLRYWVPDNLPSCEVDKFMPPGMSTYGPPDR